MQITLSPFNFNIKDWYIKKVDEILARIDPTKSSIILGTNSRTQTIKVYNYLKEKGLSVAIFHHGLTKFDRESNIKAFDEKKVNILVTPSSLFSKFGAEWNTYSEKIKADLIISTITYYDWVRNKMILNESGFQDSIKLKANELILAYDLQYNQKVQEMVKILGGN